MEIPEVRLDIMLNGITYPIYINEAADGEIFIELRDDYDFDSVITSSNELHFDVNLTSGKKKISKHFMFDLNTIEAGGNRLEYRNTKFDETNNKIETTFFDVCFNSINVQCIKSDNEYEIKNIWIYHSIE